MCEWFCSEASLLVVHGGRGVKSCKVQSFSTKSEVVQNSSEIASAAAAAEKVRESENALELLQTRCRQSTEFPSEAERNSQRKSEHL